MLKSGRAVFKDGEKYDVVFASNGLDFERVDVMRDINEYNMTDTSNCIASYIKKNKEMYYGDEELVKSILKIRSTAAIFKATQQQTIKVEDGKVVLTQEKQDNSIGMKYKLITVNGEIDYEYYEVPEGFVEILVTNVNKGMDMPPINISMYSSYNIVDDVMELNADTAEYYSLEYLKAKYAINHIEDNDFVVVESFKQARERLLRFKNAPTKIKAIDLETTGVEVGMFGQDCITGVVLSYQEDESTYYPFRQEKCSYNLPISFLQEILDVVNNQPEDVLILAHNGKFEIQGIWKEDGCYIKYSDMALKFNPDAEMDAVKNTFLRIDRDPFLLSTLINPVMRKGLHDLKSLTFRATGLYYLELGNIFKDKIRFNVLPPEIIRYYACPDPANTIKVYKFLIEQLPKDEMGIFELECKLMYVKACNEFYGMRRDSKKLMESLENEEYKVNMLGNMFRNIHRTTKNINSPDVRRDIFYNKLRCPVEVRTQTGLPSTSVVALNRIVKLGALRSYDKERIPKSIKDLNKDVVVKGEELAANKYPSLVILSKYSKAMKELGALRRIQRKSLRDRVMFGINQTGAGSGRQTSDAHQYSDAMKKLIVADSDDHYLWSADFKQIELRVLAYLAQQIDLIELEKDMNIDIHRAILHIITGLDIWEITSVMRKKGKTVNFGVVYMMSEYGLAQRNAGPAYTKEDLIDAAESINGFYNGLPQVKKFVAGNEKYVREHGYIKTLLGRYRYFREILDPAIPEKDKKSMVRAANNTPVQGFAADYMKIVECNLNDYIIMKGWDKKVNCNGVMLPMVRLMLSIHDEVLVSTHKSIPIEEIIIMFKTCMEIDIEGAPPFFAAPAMVNSWYDGKLDAYEIDLPFRDKVIEAWQKDGTSLLHAETYLEDLNNFRKEKLCKYMEGLIGEYKTAEEVAKHVTDPELTHTLIAVCINKNETFEHHEAIAESVRRYMNDDAIDVDRIIQKAEEEREDGEGLVSFEELEEYVQFNDRGEVIVEEDDQVEEEDDLSTLDIKRSSAYDAVVRSYATFAMSDVIIDLSDFKSLEDAEGVNQELASMSDAKKPYTIVYFIKGRLLKSGLKIDYIPKEINNIVKRHLEEKGA